MLNIYKHSNLVEFFEKYEIDKKEFKVLVNKSLKHQILDSNIKFVDVIVSCNGEFFKVTLESQFIRSNSTQNEIVESYDNNTIEMRVVESINITYIINQVEEIALEDDFSTLQALVDEFDVSQDDIDNIVNSIESELDCWSYNDFEDVDEYEMDFQFFSNKFKSNFNLRVTFYGECDDYEDEIIRFTHEDILGDGSLEVMKTKEVSQRITFSFTIL